MERSSGKDPNHACRSYHCERSPAPDGVEGEAKHLILYHATALC
jgi:hypothetical protein